MLPAYTGSLPKGTVNIQINKPVPSGNADPFVHLYAPVDGHFGLAIDRRSVDFRSMHTRW